MRLTTEQQELMNRCGLACSQAGADIQTAKRSVESVTMDLNELIGSLEDPGERTSWATVRNAWLEVAVLLEDASKRFEKG
jgi:hypothetical protein